MTWDEKFLELFRRCLGEYRGGNHDYESYYRPADLEFLRSIGYKPRELFDFVEDLADEGEPAESTALLVAAVRRDYFQVVQDEVASGTEITAADLPTFGDELEGIAYLPRILRKARAKLRGELDPDLMYGCGGDRKFLREHGGIHPADFLRNVWSAGADDRKIAAWVREQEGRKNVQV
ncbi:MAG: DUF5069 domain-containing protein [Akkermansiaceae bacterium]|nr:DUF5069 domain-containing protein [Akkermansiaceae bacterium]NNM29383.1 DUF5069 domain-containing protein [Akkermansiaceae bacterium]